MIAIILLCCTEDQNNCCEPLSTSTTWCKSDAIMWHVRLCLIMRVSASIHDDSHAVASIVFGRGNHGMCCCGDVIRVIIQARGAVTSTIINAWVILLLIYINIYY